MFLLSLLCLDASAQSIAITEFVNDTLGDENTDEWVEIYNYGATDVDLAQFILGDEDSDNAVIAAGSIPAGGFVVLTEDPALFVANWGVGTVGVDVIEIPSGSLANTSDEIVLTDANGNIIWSLAYADDETPGFATVLTELDAAQAIHGSKAYPGVVRDGFDNFVQGYLGYENSAIWADPDAITAINGDVGSPLAGSYGGIVQPSPTLVISGACPGVIDIRFSDMTPNGQYTMLSASGLGNRTLPNGPCAGTVTSLGQGFKVRKTGNLNGNGGGSVSPNLAQGACGAPMQILDVTTCTLTNVDTL